MITHNRLKISSLVSSGVWMSALLGISVLSANGADREQGQLKVEMSTSVESAHLKIRKLEIRSKAGTFTALKQTPEAQELVQLSREGWTTLSDQHLPAGQYDQIRITLARVSVKTDGKPTLIMELPQHHRVIIPSEIEVKPDTCTELVLSFRTGEKRRPDIAPVGLTYIGQ